MGNFSRDTFDRIKHYVSVRLQQGVPIVDADWNELQDIRKHELETFLKWFVGDGVPLGNDGFAIGVVTDGNDFSIAAGHCLVEGWDVVNESALSYTEQTEVPPLVTPSGDRTDTVYLDVWEREVNAEEAPEIVNPGIGIETCVRTKREWVVRVAKGEGAPETDPSSPDPHFFYPLATLIWKAGVIDDVADLRRTGLSLASLKDNMDRTGLIAAPDGAIYVDAEGNVGIGDKTPGSKLAVSGSKNSSRVSIEDGTSGITIGHWDGAYARLESSGRPLLITSRDEGIRFGNPDKDDELVLDTNGNVGIGTTEPKAKLDVAGTTRARGLELNPGDSDLPNFVRRLNVLTHRHATPTGKEHTPMHFHIRTPDDKQTPGQMWRYDLRGYAYFAHAPLDLVWVGHYHQGNIVNDRASCRSDTLAAVPALEVSQYTGADGHLYLKFGPILPYMLNFVLDYQCYTERVVHDREGFSVQAREDQENF